MVSNSADTWPVGVAMRMRSKWLVLVLACSPLLSWAQEAPVRPVEDSRQQAFMFAALVVAAASVGLFKVFSRWPLAERWLVGAAVVGLPLVLSSVFMPGLIFPRVINNLWLNTWLYSAIFSGLLAAVWWFLKFNTDWLVAPQNSTDIQGHAKPVERSSAPAEERKPEPAAVAPPTRPRPSADPERARVTERPPSARAASDSIFISYRRQDSADVTGRIYDRLIQRFDRRQIFKDVDSIPLGVDFRSHLGGVVGRCDLLLAVIGPQWLAVAGPNGRRLDDASDFVRIEIEAALSRNIPVIPVLVGGAELPAERDLPASLAPLTYRNGIAVRPDPDFHRDMDRLIAGLEAHHRPASAS